MRKNLSAKRVKRFLSIVLVTATLLGIVSPYARMMAAAGSTVVVSDHNSNVTGNATRSSFGIYLNADSTNDLKISSDWSFRYSPDKGGVYIDDVLDTKIQIIKIGATEYYIALEKKYTLVDGMRARIDGVFGGVTFQPATFLYDEATGKWSLTNADAVVRIEEDEANSTEAHPEKGIYFAVNRDNDWAVDANADLQPTEGGFYIDDALDNNKAKLRKIDARRYYIALDGIQLTEGTKISVKGIFSDGRRRIQFEEVVFFYGSNGKWTMQMPVNATVTVCDPGRATNGTAGGFYIKVNPTDPLEANGNWAVRYLALRDGVYVNDKLQTGVPFIKLEQNLYYVGLADAKITATEGTKVKIDGVFGTISTKVRFLPAVFEYHSATGWKLTSSVEAEPLSQEAVKASDLYEFYHYSDVTVPNDTLFHVATLENKSNVALHADVKMDYVTEGRKEPQYLEIGISKTVANDIWNKAGYNVRIIPESGTIYLFDYEKDGSVKARVNALKAVKEDFTLEVGVTNLVQYSKVVARKFYVNINEVETLSYIDWNLKHTLGKYVAARAVSGSADLSVVLESVSTKGHETVELTPVVQDLSELNSGLSTLEAKAGKSTPVGKMKDSANIALRTKVSFETEFTTYEAPRYDEFIIGIGQIRPDIVWDAAKSGYEVWFRPNKIYIGTEGEVLASVDYSVPSEFILEFGTYNVEVQANGQKVRDYGKKVYVKINDIVVLTYLDQKENRAFGQNAVIYATESTAATLTSLTSDAYLIRKANTVADLYDATAMSEIMLNQGRITQLGELPESDSIALKTKVTMNEDCKEFKLAMSKTQNFDFWGAEASGWQFWFRPQEQRVYIAYGADTAAAIVQHKYSQEFVLEIGARNVQYSTGSIYAREIYVKIDGEELISWIDTDASRKLGNYLLSYAGSDAIVTLSSLTTSGYVPVETPVISTDVIDVTQYASINLTQGKIMNLGTVDKVINKSMKMKVDITKETAEFKLALGKSTPDQFWLEGGHGYQFWFRPAQNHIAIGYGEDERANIAKYTFPNPSFELEIGTASVKYQNGKAWGTKVFIKIDGKEILSWIDTDSNRKFGSYILAYASPNAEVTLSTLNETVQLPVTYIVNEKSMDNYKLAEASTIVVPGKASRVALKLDNDAATEVEFLKFCANAEEVVSDAAMTDPETGSYGFLLKKPTASMKLTVELTAHALTTDDPQILDFYDVAGTPSITVKKNEDIGIGNLVRDGSMCKVNTALQLYVDIPEGFNSIRLLMFGSGSNIWTYKGFTMDIQKGKVLLSYPIGKEPLAKAESELFTAGNSLAIEIGTVKCYVDGIYRYDRKYIKAGKSVDTMKLMTWYDDVERGKYGSAVVTRGTDVEGADFTLRTTKSLHSLTDVSDPAETAKLLTNTILGTAAQAVYYPRNVLHGNAAQIKLYTQEGMKLDTLTVAGAVQNMTIAEDGGYLYEIPAVSGNVEFAYTIVEDNQKYSVTATDSDKLQIVIENPETVAGGSTEILVKAEKGYVPKQIMINDTDYTDRFTYDAEAKGWKTLLMGIREDKVVSANASAKEYEITVNGTEHADIIFEGDAENGKLPAGGNLKFVIEPENGWLIQSVHINEEDVAVFEGVVEAGSFYAPGDSAEIEIVLREGKALMLPGASGNWMMTAVIAGIVAAAGIIIVVTVLLVKRKKRLSNEYGEEA